MEALRVHILRQQNVTLPAGLTHVYRCSGMPVIILVQAVTAPTPNPHPVPRLPLCQTGISVSIATLGGGCNLSA